MRSTVDSVVGDRRAVAVDEHRRLAGSRAGLEEGVALARGDRRAPARRWARTRAAGCRRLGGFVALRGRPAAARALRASAAPRSALIRRRRSSTPSARSSRQIGWKVQYFGHLPPSGSRRISPGAHLPRGASTASSSALVERAARSPPRARGRVPTISRPSSRSSLARDQPARRLRSGRPRRAGGRGRRPGRGRGRARRPACRAGSGACPPRRTCRRRSRACRSCSRGRRRGRRRRRRCGRSARAARPRRAERLVALARRRRPRRRARSRARAAPAAGETRSRSRPRRRGRRRPGPAARSSAARRAWLSGAAARSARLRSSSSPKRALPAADVAGPRDRVVAGRLAVEALERVVDDRAEPQRIGGRLEALRAELVLDEPLVRAGHPALERVGAEHLARAEIARAPRASAAAPGARSGSGSPANSASTRARVLGGARGARAPARALGAQPPSASARASARSRRRLGGRRAPRARARACASAASPSGSGCEQVEDLVDERRARQRRAVLVAALPAQVEALGRPRDAGVEQVALLVGRVGRGAGPGCRSRRRRSSESSGSRRRGARELAVLERGAEQRPGAGRAGAVRAR